MNSGLSRLFYRETVRDFGVGDEKIIRPRGRSHAYAHVRVAVAALTRGSGAVVAWNAGASIASRFASAVTQGIQNALSNGTTGLEMTDVQVSVDSGSYHDEDSNDDVFREAAEKATAEALRQAHPVILEALALVTIAIPLGLVPTVEKTIFRHGAKTGPPQSNTESASLFATLPASQVQLFIAELLEATDGQANITSRISGFQTRPEPPHTADEWAALT